MSIILVIQMVRNIQRTTLPLSYNFSVSTSYFILCTEYKILITGGNVLKIVMKTQKMDIHLLFITHHIYLQNSHTFSPYISDLLLDT
jgi:hypothetical protein